MLLTPAEGAVRLVLRSQRKGLRAQGPGGILEVQGETRVCSLHRSFPRATEPGPHEVSGGVLSGEHVGAKPRRFLPLLRGHNPGPIRTEGLCEALPVFPKLLTPV